MPDDAGDAAALARLEQIGDDLEGVEQALTRLDEGTYATCEVCAAPLDEAGLAADPVRRRCESHRAP